MPVLSPTSYAVEAIRDEVRRLVRNGVVMRSEEIAHLRPFFPEREWQGVAKELQVQDYQFSDRIGDLIGHAEEWSED
jgi:hypothetical protein